jgi:hypothetical protein
VPPDCALCAWQFRWDDEPVAAYRPGEWLPLQWQGQGVREVLLGDSLGKTAPSVALAAHWAREHRNLLEAMIGPVELDGFPRHPSVP